MNYLYKKATLLLLSFGIITSSLAQVKKLCKEPNIDLSSRMQAETWGAQRGPLAVNKLIRVFFHIARSDAGYNQAATMQQIDEEFADLLEDYAPYNICFAKVGVNFIDNSDINSFLDPDNDDDVAMLTPFLVPNCINIFYHSNLGKYGGNAYDIPNTFCSVASSNIGLWRTISHEVGHCLGLSHTFVGSEYINGTNCSTLGDRVCDTQADPYSDDACFTSSNCLYTGTCQDPSGATNYSPPYQNIMSYWGDRGCTLTHFTTGQFQRINSFLETNPGLLATVSPATITVGPINVSSGFYFKTARNSISLTPSINFTGSVIASLQSQSVTLPPGFTAAPTGNGTTIIAVTCSN